MYKINENKYDEKYILLIPAMLDAHFPLLRYAFFSRNYHPVILDNEKNVKEEGLHYVNNDMCYPSILNIGQMIDALKSGKYDPKKTRLLMPTAGDACRGANYTAVLRRAVKNAGFEDVKVLSLNVRGLEKDASMIFDLSMVWRAFCAVFYGDILMILLNQTRPYERQEGAAAELWQKWIDILSEDLKSGKHLSLSAMYANFDRIAKEFAELPKTDIKKKRVGIVGELYIKYCHMGNWDMIKYLEEKGCESHTNGVSWYAIYYIDTHLTENTGLVGLGYKIAKRFFEKVQNRMVKAIRDNGLYTLPEFETLKREASGYVSYDTKVGDGWLIGAEAVSHILHNCDRVVACQPFGCMPNHVCGRGLYPSLARKLPQGHIVSVDVDSSGSKANVFNRVEMLVR